MSDVLTCIAGSQLAATQSSVTRPLSTTVKLIRDKKLYGNGLYWCKYLRHFNGATQRLKAMVPDRSVWLTASAMLSLLCAWAWHAHGTLKGAKQSARLCGSLLPEIAPRETKSHSKCMCQCAYTYCFVFVYCDCTVYSTVRCSYKCSL